MTREAFERHLILHYEACWRPLTRHVSADRAQDALQAALECIVRTKAWERFDVNGPASLTTYLCRAAFMELLKSFADETQQNHIRQELRLWLNIEERPSQVESRQINAVTLDMALRRFREPLRTFVQSYVSGHTLRELGEEFGIAHETVRKRLIEAFHTLLEDE